MNISLAIATLTVMIILLLYQLKVWKIRAFLSPGFYFSIIWTLGIVGLLLFKSIGVYFIEPFPEYINELNTLIGFTALCFITVTKIGYKKVNKGMINIDYFRAAHIFNFISVLYFILSIYVFNTEGSGFDFAEARSSLHSTLENRSVLFGYLRLLSVPLSIYAGSKITKILLKIERSSFVKFIYLTLPFLSETLFALTEGGRVAMVYSLLLYIVGASLTIPLNFKIKARKKIILFAIAIAVFANIMISWIGSVRSTADGKSYRTELIKDQLGNFQFLYGSIDYVYSSYIGYQYRRVDAVDDKLGYGQYTFNGFINWQIPFASRFGINNASIAKSFDIYYDNQETYDFSREYYYTTHSAYIPIIKDFGFTGAFFIIFFLVYISHLFFIKVQRKISIRNSIQLLFYYLFLIYWARSNFYGTLSESALIPLYGFLLIDIINILTASKKKIKRHENFSNTRI